LFNPPLLEGIALDPILANTKLIAEAWDAAGLYQVGTFPSWGRWAEWNGKFRDDVRRFVKSDPGMVPTLATRMSGSPDLYEGSGREPYHSINFVTSHDGFTLLDLVSYDHKHNKANGENNIDGSNENFSWNCGQEGPTHSREINTLRFRQIRNLATLLLLSQGVPMILGGDEMGRTQQGNNNAYCQDNEISWVNWELTKTHVHLLRFFKLLIKFRKKHSVFRHKDFDDPFQTIAWHGVKLGQPDWSWESRSLAMHLKDIRHPEDIFIIANAHWEGHKFELPSLGVGRGWFRVVDTFLEPPFDMVEEGMEPRLMEQRLYEVGPRSVVVLLGK
jgi:glycogen operon protein